LAQLRQVIKDIEERGKLPIIVGGTGFYLEGLLEGFDVDIPVADYSLRSELGRYTVKELQKELIELSPETFEKMNASDRQNPRRLVRRIEAVSKNGYIQSHPKPNSPFAAHEVLKIGLTASKEVLNSRIDKRLDSRVDLGLIEEGKALLNEGVSLERMRQLGLEYGVLADLLEGKIGEDEFKSKLKIKIHQYAKRQMTWFKRDHDIKWFDVTDSELSHRVEKEVSNWYNMYDRDM
jgi:tRNA dimethylallyltransferase